MGAGPWIQDPDINTRANAFQTTRELSPLVNIGGDAPYSLETINTALRQDVIPQMNSASVDLYDPNLYDDVPFVSTATAFSRRKVGLLTSPTQWALDAIVEQWPIWVTPRSVFWVPEDPDYGAFPVEYEGGVTTPQPLSGHVSLSGTTPTSSGGSGAGIVDVFAYPAAVQPFANRVSLGSVLIEATSTPPDAWTIEYDLTGALAGGILLNPYIGPHPDAPAGQHWELQPAQWAFSSTANSRSITIDAQVTVDTQATATYFVMRPPRYRFIYPGATRPLPCRRYPRADRGPGVTRSYPRPSRRSYPRAP